MEFHPKLLLWLSCNVASRSLGQPLLHIFKKTGHNGNMTCSRRLFLLGTATTLSGALLAACSQLEEEPEHIAKFKAKEIPVGGAVSFGNFFVAQPKEGLFKAYSAECPH